MNHKPHKELKYRTTESTWPLLRTSNREVYNEERERKRKDDKITEYTIYKSGTSHTTNTRVDIKDGEQSGIKLYVKRWLDRRSSVVEKF